MMAIILRNHESVSILLFPKNGFDQNPGANLPARISLGGLAR